MPASIETKHLKSFEASDFKDDEESLQMGQAIQATDLLNLKWAALLESFSRLIEKPQQASSVLLSRDDSTASWPSRPSSCRCDSDLTPDSEHHRLPSRQEHSLEMTLESGDELVFNDLEELKVKH